MKLTHNEKLIEYHIISFLQTSDCDINLSSLIEHFLTGNIGDHITLAFFWNTIKKLEEIGKIEIREEYFYEIKKNAKI